MHCRLCINVTETTTDWNPLVSVGGGGCYIPPPTSCIFGIYSISSVADPGCLSPIRIMTFIHPRSRISDQTTATKEEGKKFVVPFL
jgi:hypothetical protein